ncbi:MAG: hypothetical protein HOP19_09840, partial [Acidobacteria bacterium]|nr:hypothetical protein [Acidobacteriota bacterium]
MKHSTTFLSAWHNAPRRVGVLAALCVLSLCFGWLGLSRDASNHVAAAPLAACSYQLSPTSLGVPGSTSTAPKVDVITDALCPWTTISNANWIKVTGGLFQTGNGQASFYIEVNPTLASRIGTATVAGKTITITQGAGCSTITVSGGITYKNNVGANFSQAYPVSGGTGPYSFSVSADSLPPGLTLNGNVLSGQLTTAGIYNFTIKATDAKGCTGTAANTVTVNPNICPTILLNPTSLPNLTLGKAFSQTLTATGGSAPHKFDNISGELPPGLTLSPGGVLSGTPTTAGTYSFLLTATDTQDCFGKRIYTITVTCPALTVSPANLATGTVGTAYAQTLTASGGAAPYKFSLVGGALPPGLQLNINGTVSGTPTVVGKHDFSVRAIDQNGCLGTQTVSLSVIQACPAITFNPVILSSGAAGAAYTQTLTVSGGAAPYSFNLSAGNLPMGLSLSPNGAVTGTPTEPGATSFTVKATDANGCQGTRTYSLTIAPAPLASVSAASYLPGAAPDSIVAAFGVKLAEDVQ